MNMRCFDCVIVDDHVQLNDAETEEHRTIALPDILCVLPSDGAHAWKYTVLFLQRTANSIKLPATADSVHVESIRLRSAPSTLLSRRLLTEIPNHLSRSSNESLRMHVIISAASGTGMARTLFHNTLQRLLMHLGISQYQVHETQSAGTITELCLSLFIPQAEAGMQQTIIVLSGDGGLCDIVDSLYNTPNKILALPTIALIPAGTGNAMASSVGLLNHPGDALMALLYGEPVALPVFAANFPRGARYVQEDQTLAPITAGSTCLKTYGCVVASWGIHAALVADSDTVEYRKFGPERFKMAAKELLFPSDGNETHRYSGTITLTKRDGRKDIEYEQVLNDKEHMYVLATLVSNLEKGFMISPSSTPLDGRLRMIRFGPVPPQHAMQIMSSAYQQGKHVQDENVMYSEIEGFKIDFNEAHERWRRVCIDGRVVIVEEGGRMEVRKDKRRLLNILLPVQHT